MTRSPPSSGAPGAEADPLLKRIAFVVAGVVVAAARDARRSRLVIVDHDTPEGRLLEECLAAGAVELPIEHAAPAGAAAGRGRAERSLRDTDALLLNPANKTVAVLWPDTLAEPVLPLADLYASQVVRLAGSWGGPTPARDLIARAGGVQAVDAFLAAHLDERRPLEESLRGIPEPAAAELRDRLTAGWWWRRRLGVVPKLGPRTLGIDLR